jgi:nucleobase:cation symporter-1, NCS1 family
VPKYELNSTNLIAENERRGSARDLFWPWCGANVSLLALSYGSFFLGFGISFWQATFAAIAGTVLSFLLVGFSSLAGKKSNATTMVLSRAAFGVKGNVLPGALTYLLLVGWETVLVSLATLATGTVFERIGNVDRNIAMIIGFLIAVSLTLIGGVLGFSVIMKLQKYLTLITIFLTLGYIVLTIDVVKWSALMDGPSGPIQSFVGALIFGITGIGLGWVNAAADYSRYLPRTVKSASVVGWTVLGASIVPIVLVIYGAALSASDQKLSEAIAMDPIGALTTLLPTWYLVLFSLVAILGLVGGAILDLYSSGLTLVSLGVPIKRHVAAVIDGVLMLLGTIYIVWIAKNFFIPFQGFLITLGVPVAAWSAIFVTDVLLRKKSYNEKDLFSAEGIYGSVNWSSIACVGVATVVGWGFVTNSFASWLSWQGYFLGFIGGKDGAWAYSNVGVIFALAIGCVGHILLSSRKIRAQEKTLR